MVLLTSSHAALRLSCYVAHDLRTLMVGERQAQKMWSGNEARTNYLLCVWVQK